MSTNTSAVALCERLGMVLEPSGGRIGDLAVLGLRRNPRRAHLLVSTVLGKHIPARPNAVRGAADELAALVRSEIGSEDCVVFGFAETATGLGHCVADALNAQVYLHSTRRTGSAVYGEFTEGHSHATRHLLAPSAPELLGAAQVLVLVDDEISTGATALDSIRALSALYPYRRYVVASLVDVRSADHQRSTALAAAAAGFDVSFVSLAQGTVTLPAGLTDTVAEHAATELNPRATTPGKVTVVHEQWPDDVPDGGRHGVLATEQPLIRETAAALAQRVSAYLDHRPVIVVGHEELMYLPLCIAQSLADAGLNVRFQTTTRSPALVWDEHGYPLRRGFRFTAPEGDAEAPLRFLYNAQAPSGDAVLLFVADAPADTAHLHEPGGLLEVLREAGHDVVALIVTGPSQATLAAVRSKRGLP